MALRLIAIWKRNRIVYAITMSAWVANVLIMILGIARVNCQFVHSLPMVLTTSTYVGQ
ncbi:hypothetical protein BC827DRAFT_1172400 [Russula dissimulans]|nr:hypothetical protein BC827DRAFT_1172400 [Russula dissimulans]